MIGAVMYVFVYTCTCASIPTRLVRFPCVANPPLTHPLLHPNHHHHHHQDKTKTPSQHDTQTRTQTDVAARLALPDTHFLLDYVRSDLLCLRVVARALVMWETVEGSSAWVEAQVHYVVFLLLVWFEVCLCLCLCWTSLVPAALVVWETVEAQVRVGGWVLDWEGWVAC